VTPTRYMNGELGQVLAERMLALAERTGRVDAEVRSRWSLMLLHMNVEPDPTRAAAEGDRALALARQHGLRELEAYVLNDIGRAYATAGRTTEAFAAFEQASALWQEMGNEPMLADVLGIWAQGLLLRGDLAGAERTAREGLGVAQRIGNFWAQALNGYSLAYALLERGRISEAMALLWAAADQAARAGFQGPGATIPVVLTWELGALGVPDYGRNRLEAMMVASRAEKQYPSLWLLWQIIRRYLDGDATGAYQMIAGLEMPPVVMSGQESVFTALVVPAIALAAGHPLEALAAVDRLLTEMEASGFVSMRADALKTRADALWNLGRDAEAVAAYREALAEAQRQGARRAEWPALAALARLEADPAAAAAYRTRAKDVIAFLASQIDEPDLRAAFLATAAE